MKLPVATRYPDYDTKGHINNAVFLTYFEMAREAAWKAIDGDPDFPFILAEASIKYVSEAMIGEPLEISITTAEVRTKAWVWQYAITCPRDGRVVAEGRTVQVMYDYAKHATVPIPDAVRGKLGAMT